MQSLFDFDYEPADVEREIQLRAPQSTIVMRPYQEAAVTGVFERWAAGDNSTLVCIPTGGGKSVVFSEVMRRRAEQVA